MEKVILKKQYFDSKTGNTFWKGEYNKLELPPEILNNPDYIEIEKKGEYKLTSIYEDYFDVSVKNKIEPKKVELNINSLKYEDLCEIPYISQILARKILETRPFNSFDEMKEKISLKGVAETRLKENKSIIFGSTDEKQSSDKL
jgi:hypothetical protein